MTIQEFLHTKNTYYSGIAGAMGGLLGGKAWQSGLISATIATIDVACFPHERPQHIGGGSWFLGNLLSSTAVGLAAYGVGHATHNVFADNKQKKFAEREELRRLLNDDPEKTR